MPKGPIGGNVKIDLSRLDRYKSTVAVDMRGPGQGPVRSAMRQWAQRYLGFAQERFDELSRGGGGAWPPLSAATIKARRAPARGNSQAKRAVGRVASILRNTGRLFAALTPGFGSKPGQLNEDIPFGVKVGYGGPASHGDDKLSIADIASIHQHGLGAVPVREIIVNPTAQLQDQMADDMDRALGKISKDIFRK